MNSNSLFSEEFLRKLERLTILSRRSIAGHFQGERRSPKRGQSVEFTDFRLYAPGDDIRRIDWNAYARLERLFIKLFVEEQDLTVHFLIDASRSMDWGTPNKFRYSIRAAGALGYVILAGSDRLTVTAFKGGNSQTNRRLPPIRGKAGAITLFSFLSSLTTDSNPRDGKNPSANLNEYAAISNSPGPLLIFSDLMDKGWQTSLNKLAGRRFEVSLLHILSPEEVKPDLNGDFKLQDSETGSEVEITADYEVISRYQKNLEEWRESWRRFCTVRGMPYIPLETSLPLEDLLFAWLPQFGVLK